MALVGLVPFAVITGVVMTTGGVERAMMNGGTSVGTKAAEGGGAKGEGREGRRLQSTTYDFATQLEMTVCLQQGHSADSATIMGDEVRGNGKWLLIPQPNRDIFLCALPGVHSCSFYSGSMSMVPSRGNGRRSMEGLVNPCCAILHPPSKISSANMLIRAGLCLTTGTQ